MTLEQLRIFVAVAEREHMTRAAEALNLTQSAVSAAIAALEGRHGVSLFHRIGRRIELTADGLAFLDHARSVLARAETADLALSELSGLRRGTLHIQASQTIASYWLPARLVAFCREYPRISVRLTVGNSLQAARAARDGTAELCFVEGAVDEPDLLEQTVDRDRLVVVVGANHPWALRDDVTPTDFPRTQWVLREPGSGTRSEFETAIRAFGLSPSDLTIALELPSNEAVRAAVEAGGGATAISELVAEPGLRAGSLRAAGVDLPERSFRVLRHRDRHRSKASEAFMAIVAGHR